MVATREQLDQIINEHFMYEATDNLDGVMESLGQEILHEVVPSPVGVQTDKSGIRAYYTNLFENVRGESVEPIKRYYGDDFVIDETLWNGYINDGAPFLCDGKSGPVSFRLLHVFEVQDGKITREQAWCDLAAIQKQLGAR
jgi:ketosteroid isomerase-like protein